MDAQDRESLEVSCKWLPEDIVAALQEDHAFYSSWAIRSAMRRTNPLDVGCWYNKLDQVAREKNLLGGLVPITSVHVA